MKSGLKFMFLFILPASFVFGKNLFQSFDKPSFYAVLKSGKVAGINEQLDFLSTSSIGEKDAYEGALLMRKAGLVKLPSEKLKLFKKGRIKLESALLKDNGNGEYHFLRLIIEEHAPKIVKYHTDIETDKQDIIKTFKNLPRAVQQAIIDYSKNSKVLSPQDF